MLASVLGYRDQPGSPGVVSMPGGRARWRIGPADMLITAAFALLLVAQIAHHDMWRDELHSWGLVLASPTLADLYANLNFTGHPGLWYFILWLGSVFTDSPFTLQVVHGAVGILLIGTIGLVSPFSRLEKVLLLCSYFVLFEYTVIARNYGIGFLLALIYAQMRATRPDRHYLNASVLGLLANTNLFAFILSGVFALEYLIELLSRRGGGRWRVVKAVLPPAALYLAFVALAVAAMWPSPDISWRTTGEPLREMWNPARLLVMVSGNVEAVVPVFPLRHWDASAEGALSVLSVAGVPILAVVYFLIFRGHRQLLLIPGLTFFGSVAVSHLVYANSMRHWGINFVAFIAAYWMQRVWSPQRSRWALGLLAISAAAGIAISVQQSQRTFSEGHATAEWIRENGPVDAVLVGTPDTLASVVAQYLGRPIYFLDCSCTDMYAVFHRRRDDFDKSQIPERLAQAVGELKGRPILFLNSDPLNVSQLTALQALGIAATHLISFDEASTDENFHVYRVAAGTGSVRASELRSEMRGAL